MINDYIIPALIGALDAISVKIIYYEYRFNKEKKLEILQKVYENALKVELNLRGLKIQQHAPLKVYYKNELAGDY